MSDYPLDLLSPVRHVVTAMEGAALAPSPAEMALSYRHPNPADITRVRSQEGAESDNAAKLWLVNRALEEL